MKGLTAHQLPGKTHVQLSRTILFHVDVAYLGDLKVLDVGERAFILLGNNYLVLPDVSHKCGEVEGL